MPAADAQDVAAVLSELLARPSSGSILERALTHALTLLDDQANAYAVLRRGPDRVVAVVGYPQSLIGTPLSGPWAGSKPRLLRDGTREIYEMNTTDVQEQLDACGMRGLPLTLVVPLSDRGRGLGALVFDRTSTEGITPEQQEAVARWATAVAPLLGVIDSRDEWRQTARQITSAFVEAVESQEFDALGHGQAVADLAVRLGRAVGLVEREQEELWYAALLHDIGKIHGEVGHPQVGANFLHGVPHLAQAQKAIRHHHERWDGQGEPDGLSGEDISLYARILAVANAYVRSGNLEQVRGQAGKALDPRLVGLLEKLPQDR
ncbi:HD-GYP domain, c-di-GMP phosphodiesterase class II (or its inactivated variant) [Deinococcus hopiensis KR-140]|uniref:HD-GYP domain, c-di-GMP phosphodiesterase class II (Or its inactivated variant) n=2 Tax=Deinococcus TaxID=1298 RepID=A0A1W1VKB7_9DEIO|nr:HD-GYP domain, c-di-GMP phosphodiesterase class II (or its inactivated variant) [Deinococcus hopiensis KR-140]